MTRIEQGQHLLKMIEGVDVKDTDTLDEIDARFWCFLKKLTFVKPIRIKKPCPTIVEGRIRAWRIKELGDVDTTIPFLGDFDKREKYGIIKKYTRSLDALHDAMPDGWKFYMAYSDLDGRKIYTFVLHTNDVEAYGEDLPTMHLAWLHAIIQAYIYREGCDAQVQ